MKLNNVKFIICGLFFIQVFANSIYAQGSNPSLQHLAAKAKEVFTWDVRESPPNGSMMFLDIPYNVKEDSHNYISLTVARRYSEKRPAFISLTLPDEVNKNKGLTLLFSNLAISKGLSTETDKLHSFLLNFNEHHQNNNTLTSRLWKGFLYSNNREDSIDIFNYFMSYDQLYISFYDTSRIQKIAIPLSFFQKQYKTLPAATPIPIYSTGDPADTALTPEERMDKKIFDDGSIPTSWEIAGIKDPIRLKHFIKYFQYLMNHDLKKEMVQFIKFPQNNVIPECKDKIDFLQNYNQIFDKELKESINSQKLNQIFRNSGGAYIGNLPNIIINSQNGFYKIYIVNDAMAKKMGEANEYYEKMENQN